MRTLKYWLPSALIIILLSGLIYVGFQQNYRQNANDPQVQVAEDVSKIIESGQDATALNGQGQTDLRKSLSMFILIYDKDGKAIAGNGQLDGKIPDFPKSALEAAKSKQNRITWMPTNNLRFAAVVQSYQGPTPGYVVTARSLREIENRIKQTGILIAAGAAIALLASLLFSLVIVKLAGLKKNFTGSSEEQPGHRETASLTDHQN